MLSSVVVVKSILWLKNNKCCIIDRVVYNSFIESKHLKENIMDLLKDFKLAQPVKDEPEHEVEGVEIQENDEPMGLFFNVIL